MPGEPKGTPGFSLCLQHLGGKPVFLLHFFRQIPKIANFVSWNYNCSMKSVIFTAQEHDIHFNLATEAYLMKS
ncbi:MAG: hypothetical protein IJT52_05870, partial [Spirochaetales bacterium]|nr:hypothetical protein [Spirochaetales bacterium]